MSTITNQADPVPSPSLASTVPETIPGLRYNANWRRLWLAQAVSLTGDGVFNITVMIWVAVILAKGEPWAPVAASGVLIAAAVPVLAVAPFAGVWIDRWDKRRIMMTADASRAAIITSLLAVAASGHRLPLAADLIVVYAVVAAESSLAQFFNPSRLALVGLIVAPEDRPRASARLQATVSATFIIAPPIATPMLFAFGIQWAIIIDAASFMLSFAVIRSIRSPTSARPLSDRSGFRAEFRDGLRFFITCPALIAMSSGVVICALGTGALNGLEVFFLRDNLHAAATWLGAFYAASGAGAVAGALLAGWAGGRVGPARVFWVGTLTAGLLLLVYSRLTQVGPALAVVAAVGCMFGALNAAGPPILLAIIPQNLIGRVMSVFNPLQQVANIGGLAAAGFLVSTVLQDFHTEVCGIKFGPIDTTFLLSALLVTAAGIAMIRPLSKIPPPAQDPPSSGRPRRRH
jgi:MFS family permease